jgi:putative membrane protein
MGQVMTKLLPKVSLALAGVLLACGSNVRADNKPDPKGFVPQALADGIAEVEFAKMAEKHANSDEVKQYARRLIKDHTEANNHLMDFAKEMKLAVVEGVSKERREKMTTLSKLKGNDFDREFLRTMVHDHEMAIKEFEHEAKNGTQQKVKDFAEKALPTLREHLKTGRTLLDNLKAK